MLRPPPYLPGRLVVWRPGDPVCRYCGGDAPCRRYGCYEQECAEIGVSSWPDLEEMSEAEFLGYEPGDR